MCCGTGRVGWVVARVWGNTAILPSKTHNWSPDQAFDWIHGRAIDWIGTNYIKNTLKFNRFFQRYYKLYWINYGAYNLDFRVFLQHPDDCNTVISFLGHY